MARHIRYQVTKITTRGDALYLMWAGLGVMAWTPRAEDAFTYDDYNDAFVDAREHGGIVDAFERYDGRD